MPASSVSLPITMRLPFTPSSPAVARQHLKTWLQDHGGSIESIENARLVVSELVANSVRHAQPLSDGQIVVAWTLQPRGLQLSVTDGGGSTRPRNVHASTSALGGRGMAIVEGLAQDWWTERSASRSTVHALMAV